MQTRIQRWGNSLAVRIPKALAAESNIEEGMSVELSHVQGRLVVTPVQEAEPTLEDLLAGVTEENLHGEWDTGPAVGKEVW